MGGFSIWHWLLVLAVIILVFGTRRLSTLGSDLGTAIKGFRESMRDNSEEPQARTGEAKLTSGSSNEPPGTQTTPKG